MLWWDDGFGRKKSQDQQTHITQNGQNGDVESSVAAVSCYRSTGAVPIPRKVSKPSPARRKLSAPTGPDTPTRVPPPRKLSCPAPQATFKGPERNYSSRCKPIVELQLLKASQEILKDPDYETFSDLCLGLLPTQIKPRFEGQSSTPLIFPKINRLKILTGKTVTLEPDMKKELKRGSMKEKWGLNLSYTLAENKLQVAVNKVSMFSPAAKAGLTSGNTILVINDWQIEAMDQPQVAMSLLLAAGFSVNLAWKNTKEEISEWKPLDLF